MKTIALLLLLCSPALGQTFGSRVTVEFGLVTDHVTSELTAWTTSTTEDTEIVQAHVGLPGVTPVEIGWSHGWYTDDPTNQTDIYDLEWTQAGIAKCDCGGINFQNVKVFQSMIPYTQQHFIILHQTDFFDIHNVTWGIGGTTTNPTIDYRTVRVWYESSSAGLLTNVRARDVWLATYLDANYDAIGPDHWIDHALNAPDTTVMAQGIELSLPPTPAGAVAVHIRPAHWQIIGTTQFYLGEDLGYSLVIPQ